MSRFFCINSSLVFSFAGSGKCHLNNLACNSTERAKCKSFRGKMESLNSFTFNKGYFFSTISPFGFSLQMNSPTCNDGFKCHCQF